jgi:endonuclease YncB( thermonuclease family)
VLPASADDGLPGPIPARVLDVIDGDTVAVEAEIWLDQRVVTRVRLADVDTPEMRADCDGERALAEAARDRLAGLLAEGAVTLSNIHYGTYAGRVVATVSVDGRDAGATLLREGLAVGYAGRGPRHDWCATLAGQD